MADRVATRPTARDDRTWRSFRGYWLSQSSAQVAGQLLTVGFPLIAVQVLGFGTFEASLSTALQFIPYLVITPLVGVLADRIPRLPLIVVSHLGRATLLAICAGLAHFGHLAVAAFWGVALVAGALNAVASVATTALVPDLVPRSMLAAANGRLQMTVSVAQVLGPATAGVLVATLGGGVFVAMAVVFAAAAVALLPVRAMPRPEQEGPRRHWLRDLREGFGFVWRTPTLNVLVVQMTMFNFFEQAVLSVFMLSALKLFAIGSAGVGVVLGIGALGGVVGAALAGRVAGRFGSRRTLLWSAGVSSIGPFGLLLLADVASEFVVPVAACVFVVYGVGLTIFNVQSNVVRHEHPRRLQGRLAAVFRMSAFSAISAGAAFAGLLIQTTGFEMALAVSCCGLLLTFGMFCLRSRRLTGFEPKPCGPSPE